MNPGYLSSVLICVTLVLLASGWKDILFHGISRRSILLFFAGWLLLLPFSFSVAGGQVQLTVVYLLLLAAVATVRMDTFMEQVHVLCSAGMLGLAAVLMQELQGFNLLLHPVPGLNAGLVLAILTLALGRQPLWQFTAITIGLILAELLHVALHRHTWGNAMFGGGIFRDRWWYVFALSRGLTVIGEQAVRLGSGALKHWSNRFKEGGR